MKLLITGPEVDHGWLSVLKNDVTSSAFRKDSNIRLRTKQHNTILTIPLA